MKISIAVAVMGTAIAATFVAAPASAAAEGDFRQGGAYAVSGSYLVVLKDTVNVDRAADLAVRHGGAISRVYRRVLNGFSVKASEKVARSMAADPAVAHVQQDVYLSVIDTQPNPPSWGLDRIDRNVRGYNNSYEYPSSGAGVRVYVLDTGIRTTHQDFGGRASSGWDFVDEDSDAGSDCNGHGTLVAGIIGSATYGVAKQVNLISVRVADCGGHSTMTDLVDGVDFVTEQTARPAIANISIGFQNIVPDLDAAIATSIASGVTYTIGAGNGDESKIPRDACLVSPSRVPAAITVAATDSSDRRSGISNYGSCVDIFAPGVDIRSTWSTSDTATEVRGGTSTASPHVAGAAAIVLGAQPTLTPAQVRDRLVNLDATVGAVSNPGTGSPNRLLFVRSGPLKVNLSCSPQTGSYSCQAEAIGAVAPNPFQWSTLPSSTCVVTRNVTITVTVTDSLLASASNTKSFVCRARCNLQSIGARCVIEPGPQAIVAGRPPEQ